MMKIISPTVGSTSKRSKHLFRKYFGYYRKYVLGGFLEEVILVGSRIGCLWMGTHSSYLILLVLKSFGQPATPFLTDNILLFWEYSSNPP